MTDTEEEGEETGQESGCGFSGWRRRVMGEHAPQCPHRPVDCSLRCEWRGKKKDEVRLLLLVCQWVGAND